MRTPLAWKTLIVLGVIALAAFAAFPPSERIALGLDLRGGAHILMQVETGSALKYELDLTQSRLGQAFKDAGLGYSAIVPVGEASLEIRGTETARADDVRKQLGQSVSGWDISDAGAGTWRLAMPLNYRQ